jgi:hypothetical protein
LHSQQDLKQNGTSVAFWQSLFRFKQGIQVRPLATFQNGSKRVVVNFKDIIQGNNARVANVTMNFVFARNVPNVIVLFAIGPTRVELMNFYRHLAEFRQVKGSPHLRKAAFTKKREKNVSTVQL